MKKIILPILVLSIIGFLPNVYSQEKSQNVQYETEEKHTDEPKSATSSDNVKKGDFKETQTLVDFPDNFGAYGSIEPKITRIHGDYATFIGGRGGLILNEKYVFGAASYGLASSTRSESLIGDPETRLAYGGFMFEYIENPRRLIHFSAGILVGIGVIYFNDNKASVPEYGNDKFLVIEPEIGVSVNVTEFMKMTTALSYRGTAGANIAGISDNGLSFISGNVIFKFGKF